MPVSIVGQIPMTIEILPARLANQIAAGEVVERPASVIKELIENSLDAGATHIQIDIDKGGIKRIRITDNGCGIVKDELQLALSRHATSKIKNLADLEAINSLGFRGEALASISSVARLTLTSKPVEQATAWQASAQGRDMEVNLQPAAHPNGTTIEVLDLFFNTPARRKFLRTEKTEFNHIDEVVRRIALANFYTTFVLTHNGKMVRQYRAVKDKSQYYKRVAMVCGQKFMENAIEIDCPHDNMTLTGWLASPNFYRGQNDLCYSYVNGRMMRDKLINHAIRQAYADLLPTDAYPAFVLFLTLDYKDVDVNVHPSKHEVRFHQSRYVHDFIYSVCNKALYSGGISFDQLASDTGNDATATSVVENKATENTFELTKQSVEYGRADYPNLQQVNEIKPQQGIPYSGRPQNSSVSSRAVENYQQLITPVDVDGVVLTPNQQSVSAFSPSSENQAMGEQASNIQEQSSQCATELSTELFPPLWANHDILLHIESNGFGVIKIENKLRVLSFAKLAQSLTIDRVRQRWQAGFVSQPLLLPIVLTVSESQLHSISLHETLLTKAGIVVVLQPKNRVQIRQFPSLLREQNVSETFIDLIDELVTSSENDQQNDSISETLINFMAKSISGHEFNEEQMKQLLIDAKKSGDKQFISLLRLNSVPIDLTSEINQLT